MNPMIRRAEWRRLPQDPNTPMGWCLHELKGTVIAITVILLVFGSVAAAAIYFGLILQFFLCIPIAALLIQFVRVIRSSFQHASVAKLGASPAPGEEFRVDFSLKSSGICTGHDRGIATFVDGWLHVEGLHTTFSLRPVDLTGGVGTTLLLSDGQQIRLRSMAGDLRFEETLRKWRHFPFELPVGEPVLPPLKIHGSALRTPLTNLVSYAAVVVAQGALITWFLLSSTSMAFGLPVLLGAEIYFAVLLAGEIRDLKKLHRLDRQAIES